MKLKSHMRITTERRGAEIFRKRFVRRMQSVLKEMSPDHEHKIITRFDKNNFENFHFNVEPILK